MDVKWSASHTGHITSREKNLRYPLNRRHGQPQNQSGHSWEEKTHFTLPGIKSPYHPVNMTDWVQGYHSYLQNATAPAIRQWRSMLSCHKCQNHKFWKYNSLRRVFFHVCLSIEVHCNTWHNVLLALNLITYASVAGRWHSRNISINN